MPIVSKQALRDDLPVKFPDNTEQFITPAKLRDYLLNFVDSNVSLQILPVTSSPVATPELIDIIGLGAGASVVEFPDVVGHGDRFLYVINDSGGTVTLNRKGTDTIDGGTSTIIRDNSLSIFARTSTTTNWNTVLATGDISLNDLIDVILTFPALGEILQFDGSDWTNVVIDTNTLADVDTSTNPPVLFDTLIWDGAKFVPGAQSGGLVVASSEFNANDAIFPATDPAVADSRNGHPIIAFDDTTAEKILFNSSVDPNYAGGDVTVNIDWVASSLSNDVVWGVEFERIAPGITDIDSDSFAAQQTATDTTNATSGIVTRSTITLTQAQADGIEALDSYRLRIERVATDGGDTLVGDAEIIRITVEQ